MQERIQTNLHSIEFELRELKIYKAQKNKLYQKIETQKGIRDNVKDQINGIRAQPGFTGEEGVERVRIMEDQKKHLNSHLQKRKEASLDMLTYLNEKLMRKNKLQMPGKKISPLLDQIVS